MVKRLFFIFAWYPIDGGLKIAETLIISLTPVDAMLGEGLRAVILAKFALLIFLSKGRVDLGVSNPCCVVVQKRSSPPQGLMRISWKLYTDVFFFSQYAYLAPTAGFNAD